jgi:hypothetical protein
MEGVVVSSTHAVFKADAPWNEPASTDDIFGMARFLAEAVTNGKISEAEGEAALWEWASPDRDVLERAGRHLTRNSPAERLVSAAFHHAA